MVLWKTKKYIFRSVLLGCFFALLLLLLPSITKADILVTGNEISSASGYTTIAEVFKNLSGSFSSLSIPYSSGSGLNGMLQICLKNSYADQYPQGGYECDVVSGSIMGDGVVSRYFSTGYSTPDIGSITYSSGLATWNFSSPLVFDSSNYFYIFTFFGNLSPFQGTASLYGTGNNVFGTAVEYGGAYISSWHNMTFSLIGTGSYYTPPSISIISPVSTTTPFDFPNWNVSPNLNSDVSSNISTTTPSLILIYSGHSTSTMSIIDSAYYYGGSFDVSTGGKYIPHNNLDTAGTMYAQAFLYDYASGYYHGSELASSTIISYTPDVSLTFSSSTLYSFNSSSSDAYFLPSSNASSTWFVDCSAYDGAGILSSSTVASFSCNMQKVAMSVAQFVVVPPSWSTGFLNSAYMTFKGIFPFNVFYSVLDSISAVSQNSSSSVLAVTIPIAGQNVSYTILSPNILDSVMSTSTVEVFHNGILVVVWLGVAFLMILSVYKFI